jgi:hypothetical protein
MTMTNVHTLTVGQLREMLAGMNEDMPVLIAAKTGDYWGTVTAGAVGDAEEMLVEWDPYHQKYAVTEQQDDENGEWAVVISR